MCLLFFHMLYLLNPSTVSRSIIVPCMFSIAIKSMYIYVKTIPFSSNNKWWNEFIPLRLCPARTGPSVLFVCTACFFFQVYSTHQLQYPRYIIYSTMGYSTIGRIAISCSRYLGHFQYRSARIAIYRVLRPAYVEVPQDTARRGFPFPRFFDKISVGRMWVP